MRNTPPQPPQGDPPEYRPNVPVAVDAVGAVGAEAGTVAALPPRRTGQAGGVIRPDSDIEVVPVGDRSRGLRRRLAYAFLIGYAVLMFVPFAWSVVTSFKTLPDSTRLTFIPDPVTLDAWRFVFANLEPSVVTMFVNSFIISAAVTVTNLVLGSLAGYAFARLNFPGRTIMFLLVLATLMIPDQLRLVPVYILFNDFGLTRGVGQYVSVILLLAISATSVFLMRQYFLTIPKDLEEAAKIDGAGTFTTFSRVMLPLATPALAAVTILQFQGSWNGFFWPSVFLRASETWTLPIGLTLFRLEGGMANNWPPLMAVIVLATVPILALYLYFQRYFVEGIAASGVKG
jgi:multiple sugar transport system permease protein